MRERHQSSLSLKSPALTRLISASPSSVLVPIGSSSRLAAARHISRSRPGSRAAVSCCRAAAGSRRAAGRYRSAGCDSVRPPRAPRRSTSRFRSAPDSRTCRPRGVDAARLLDAEIVAGISEAGPQAEAAQIQPADLVRRALLAAVGDRPETRRPAGGWRRAASELRPSPMVCSSLRGQFLRRDRRLRRRRETACDQLQRLLQRLLR